MARFSSEAQRNENKRLKTTMNILYTTLAAFALACVAFPTTSRAQLSPAPDGGYPSENTAEGDGALFSLTSGANNTAIGSGALFGNTTENSNTAIGNRALTSNTTGSANTATGLFALEFNSTGNWNTATGRRAVKQHNRQVQHRQRRWCPL